ncbi:hypothetical protein NHJ6243_001086 [Beauveria neobassiana]
MKAILQRVLSGSVTVEKELVSSIGRGVLVFAAVAPGDTEKEMESMANKWKKSVTDINGEVLCVSQFTLLAKTTKGTKPDFHGAANPEEARRLYQYFVQKVQAGYQADRVKDGRFQAMMEVSLINDGPVTLELNVGGKATQENGKESSMVSLQYYLFIRLPILATVNPLYMDNMHVDPPLSTAELSENLSWLEISAVVLDVASVVDVPFLVIKLADASGTVPRSVPLTASPTVVGKTAAANAVCRHN